MEQNSPLNRMSMMRGLKIVDIEERIIALRGHRMMLDRDLAELYGVSTKAVNQAVKRNRERFPDGFIIRLTRGERTMLIRVQPRLNALRFAASSSFAFTDYGVAMLSSVLRSPRATMVNVRIIQAFVRMRRLAAVDVDLKQAVSTLQTKVGEHDEAIQKVLDALGLLVTAPEPRPILGFGGGE